MNRPEYYIQALTNVRTIEHLLRDTPPTRLFDAKSLGVVLRTITDIRERMEADTGEGWADYDDRRSSEGWAARLMNACHDMVVAWEKYDATSWPSYDARQDMLKTYRDAARAASQAKPQIDTYAVHVRD